MEQTMNAKSLLKKIGSTFSALFGKLHWNSPPWVNALHQKAVLCPKLFWSVFSLVGAGLIASAYTIHWYQNLPEPTYVTASITVPAITANEEELVPNPLSINFVMETEEGGQSAQSVAPINLVGKSVSKGIEINPEIAGEWRWESDSQLIFTPTEDWPAGQHYTIHTAPGFFTENTQLKSPDFSFSTQPLSATIKEFKLYQDPVDAEKREAVATIEFNYPINEEGLKNHSSLMFLAIKKGTVDLNTDPVTFSYSFDANKRVAYLHSELIKIKAVERYLRLTLGKEITTSTGSKLNRDQSQNLLIPDNSTFLKVLSTTAAIIRNDKDRPEQVLSVETTLGFNENDFNKSVHLYLLPKDHPATRNEHAKLNYAWQNPGEVTNTILALATPLKKEAIPVEHNYSSLHSFKFATQSPRYIYIKIDKGMKGLGGFTLSTDYVAVIPVPEYPKEISFLHKGSLLALNGEKKLSVLIRGVPAVKFDFARVIPHNINQLITQTQGDFNNPYFINPSFNQQNISQIFSDIQQFVISDITKQQYTALDLSQYLSAESGNNLGPQGLFLVQATGWDIQNNTPLDVKTSRLILVTDLGMLVKDNHDGSHDVFIDSISQGMPVMGVNVTVLGKNGLPILSRSTDSQGRVNFPSLKDFVDDREPVVYLASLNNDVSFIPFNNYNRQLNFTKFDIGGIYSNSQDPHSLSAYLFSDRGIYRPGDTVHLGMIVKQAYAQGQASGLPLQVVVQDSRGTTIKDEKIALNDMGYMDLNFTTNTNSPTGQYTINLYLVKDEHAQNLLGFTTVRIAEFQPDRMRISSHLEPKPREGWTSPEGLKAEVTLWNLYGAPATDRKISAKLILTPEKINFDEYPDYVFSDPLADPKKPAKIFTETLKDTKTNNKGEAEFSLNLDHYEKTTYRVTFFAEGFEADGGRSVTTQSKALISPLAYFLGYKADGDLSFIKQHSDRSVDYIAINPQLIKKQVNDLQLQLISLHPITTLVKKPDGTFQYQSVIQSSVVNTSPFTINEQATTYKLPTDKIGEYSLNVLDKEKTILSQLKFTIVGASQTPLAKNAELSIKLNKEEYKAGEEIELQITAPYTGSGLITVERDKVYASQWFKSETTNSVQTIRVPSDFQGNGYVNVAFIRDWDSPELFISPLSYSVVPFSVNHDDHDINIDLKTAAVARPGEEFTINYHSDKPGKMIIFAVDEGILQVSKYETPDPLAFFFQKHALEVLTQQNVDQILPKFIQDRELSAVGGDDGDEDLASRLNPFKRKTDLPVAYWSGIIDTDATDRQVVYQVPDYFNGTMRIMAVAVAADSVGANQTSAQIRGDFILSPNVPTFVAPGDEFEVSSSVANNLKDSGEHADVTVTVATSPELELLGPNQQHLEIAEGHEQRVHFKVRAKAVLGSSLIRFTAQSGNKTNSLDSTLSVRPATAMMTTINSGSSKDRLKSLDIVHTLYPQYRSVDATMSTSPLILIYGLQRYLDNYPYGCTEQLTSKALPLLAMNSQSWFNQDKSLISEKMNATIQMLSQRQMSSGGFSYWPGLSDNSGNTFASVYAMHFLTEAREQGFNVPNDLFFNGISYLKDFASQNATDLDKARIQAYAIYILTRNELVTTNYLTNLQLYLQQDPTKAWQKDLAGAYIAATYQMLKSTDEANKLIGLYEPQSNQQLSYGFNSNDVNNAQYLYLVARHFPNLLAQVGEPLLMQLVKAMNSDEMNTVLAGYTSMALSAYQQSNTTNPSTSLFMTELLTNNQEKKISAEDANYQHLAVGIDLKKLQLNNPEQLNYFYQLTQSGFNKTLVKAPLKKGIEIYREYRNEQGKVITTSALGSDIEVHIQIRALGADYLSNIAIEDLLPGGFEVVRDSVNNGTMDYVDAREDRVNFFGSIGASVTELVYKIKAVNPGTYVVPPTYAQAMYHPELQAHGISSKFIVTQ
jgi:hypothetical protein